MARQLKIRKFADGVTQVAPAKRGDMQLSKPQIIKALPSYQGRRLAFRYVQRELLESDLSNSGVQKLLLDELKRAKSDFIHYRSYIERFHEADKRAAVLEERTRTIKAIDLYFGLGKELGCLILGLTIALWKIQPLGWLSLSIGVLLVGGAYLARIINR